MAMADTTARRRYTSNKRPATVKQTTREEPGAHPDHVEGDGRAGGTTDRRVDVHSDHGGANFGDGEAPVAAVVKTSNQQDIKHHGIETKLEQPNTRAEVHRGALATVKRLRRWCCRPRGRKRRTSISQRRQATRVGWLGVLGLGDAMASFAKDGKALRRR